MAPTLEQAIDVAIGKAFVILDGTLLRIDRVGMASGYDRGFYSGKHKCHGLNVQVIADPAGRLVWISPPLPGARHDMGAAREHGIIDALTEHRIRAAADTAYQGAGPTVAVPHRRRRKDPDTGRFRPLSHNQREVNAAHSRRRGPGERVNAELKNWKILRKIRSSPNRAGQLIAAVQTLMIVNT
ncbi:IS5/IS1182 family transposase [Pseudonocardia sp. HH130629-09]|uniref:IS5/IS1182 family transposase n=1 Tax=Pseudonocardia sp. HH130629-09 TaxID=1641402 RepID=UPI000760F295|nr:IS5/IS1182 family transposase [Pseudonocardia sp. HH130629-09]